MSKRTLLPQIGRWWFRIQEFTFDMEYRKRTTMAHVDALSRPPYGRPEDIEVVSGLQALAKNVRIGDRITISQHNNPKSMALKDRLGGNQHLTKGDRPVQNKFQLRNGKLFR